MNAWLRTWKADPRLAALADRHYSRKTPGASQFAPPGLVLPLITPEGGAGWCSWITNFPDAEWLRDAWACTLFRNEAQQFYLSSDLVTQAVAATVAAWGEPPAGGTVTTVDPRKIRSANPGFCFIQAGFVRLPERTKDRDLVILRLAPEDHPPAAEAGHTQLVLGAAA